ncbi:hypothetical protein VNI00_002184 [Paramarasmius palmivorus]|uniref:Uncharacterized protein n=1 Tax=Paramarasmius palmivorus TaxID=297713 RepID=A0AAW0E6C1_9AGAR
MSSNKLNAAGLEPSQSKELKERELQSHEQPIVQAIKETTFSVYESDAVFQDPIGIANGAESIRAQFIGLTKTVNSLLTLKLSVGHKVLHHTEEWDHSKSTTSEDGFFGMLNEQRKKITASLTDKIYGGKDSK